MTLDQAQTEFRETPIKITAAKLLQIGLEYLADDMIGQTTFTRECVVPVMGWLSESADYSESSAGKV
jgi:hypothetical protein